MMNFFTRMTEDTKYSIKVILGLGLIVAAIAAFTGRLSDTPGIFSNVATKGVATEEMSYGREAAISYQQPAGIAMDMDMMPVPTPEFAPGSDAEAFEVKEYYATIETRSLQEDCDVIAALKGRTEIIFESTSEYERGCTYTFKVAKDQVAEVLALLETLDPKEINESTYTIKREVDSYADEITILETKLTTLETMLAESLAAYENVTALATRTGDVEGMARVIEGKLAIVERLTQAKLDTVAQLDRLTKAKGDALDKLTYTYFHVYISENDFVDGGELKDGWIAAVQNLVRELSALAQDLTLGFVAFAFTVVKFVLYGTLILFVGRFGFRFAKRVWRA